MLVSLGLHVGASLRYKLASSLACFHPSVSAFLLLPLASRFMAPKQGAGRGRVRRSRGGCTPRSGHGGRHGTSLPPSSSSPVEGFWRHDFLLRVRGRSATRILLPSSFSAIVADLGLDGLLLHLQGSGQAPSYVDLEFDRSRLVFHGSGWSPFSRRLSLRDGDVLCCRFDGERS